MENRKNKILKKKDIEEAKEIYMIFTNISEENKNLAIAYMSALRDTELICKTK